MGQQVSLPSAVTQPPGERTQLRPLQAPYVPLCDVLKAGDAGVAVGSAADEAKDTMDKILEFGVALRCLPRESEMPGRLQTRSPEQQMKELMSSVDSVDALFQHISQLAGLPTQDGLDPTRSDWKRDSAETMPGMFDARVASYVKNLQALYQMTKKEKYRHEQRLMAARAHAMSLLKVSPPPLPLPTQNCLTMGWDLVVMLLKATRKNNPEQYEQALQVVKDNLKSLKPTAYSDSMYLAPSASSAFNLLSECLGELAYSGTDGPPQDEMRIEARTIETLAEVGLTRGSLATMLFVVLWLVKQAPTSSVDLETSIAKLAALKEQPMYGKCEASGELYSCGQNSYGELGTGDDIERHQLTSVALCGWDDIRQVVSGNETMAVLTNDGAVLTCGLNKSGQCGQGHFDERVMMLRPVHALRSQRVKFIAASNGCEHMIALTDSGFAYSWGYNDRGQLGHENLTTKIHVPKLIESLKDKKLSYASVSYHHSAVITDAGELYTFGMNDCGQLGLDHTQHQSTPQLVKSLEGTEVSTVACGLYHTIICTAAGELYSCGKNDYGQLGLAHNRQIKIPTLVAVPNEMVCFVACGYYHSMIVTTGGRSFSFGRNDYGQLGIGSKIHQNVPSVVALSANTRMVRATCGCYHTVLLSEQGQVFVFGRNNKGQLGNRGSADALLPVPLKVRPEKNSRRCVDVAAGFYTTSLIVERKRENDDGDFVMLDQSCVVSVCGRVDIDRSGEIEGLSNFGSISTVGVSLFRGKWFYEVEVVTSGLIQVGWIDGYFQGSSDQGEGVGDHAHSWSYDGNRQRRWNSGSSSYGEKWRAGDIIGCLLDLTTQEMTFFRNGVNLGVAYSELNCSVGDKRSGMMPGISLERGEIIRINLGYQPFAYPPTTGLEFESISRAVTMPSSSAVLQSPEDQLPEDTTARPPPLEGSASTMVGNKLFVVGGMIVHESASAQPAEPTNEVWVYDIDTKNWERWADFPIEICHHQVVAIDDNQVLVLGGETNCAASRHMDLYKCSTVKNADGSLPTWTQIQAAIGAATSMPHARAFHTASTIRVRLDTIVFMYGGKSVEDEVLGDAWYLSLEDFAWSRLPSSVSLDPGPRLGCSSAVIGECVYVFGGQDREEKFRSDLWRYNTFDRLWHLCHDDSIGASKEATAVSRSDSLLEPRAHYSMCSDLGNIWILGGINRTNTILSDLWCFSVASQKWSHIEVNTHAEIVDGCSSAALFVQTGAVTALPTMSDFEPAIKQGGDMFIFGGRVSVQGQTASSSRVRRICSTNPSGSYRLDMTKNLSTTGKAGHVLSVLRAKCGATNRSTQHCVPEAFDSAVCLLSHLDRLAGNDIPAEDVEAVQLSRCLYRSLCIDPKESTFSALYALLENVTSRFFAMGTLDEQSTDTPLVTHVLYPMLVTIRLLKLNFFEFSRSCLDASEIDLPTTATLPGGILCLIREMLFTIADYVPKQAMSGEILWFYHAVKQETTSAIYHGFSVLFPSLLDRLQVMNRLMVHKPSPDTELTQAQQSLIPMLVPCFTSAKMLFQLICDPNILFRVDGLADNAVSESVVTFMNTLLDTLWEQTKNAIEHSSGDTTKLVRSLDAIEANDEFKCLNIMLRAAIFWCSCSVSRSWMIIESICSKLVTSTSNCLDQRDIGQKQIFPIVIQRSFSGKLLPFVLLSVFSLPSVREALPALLDPLWPQLESLSEKLHTTLVLLSKQGLSQPSRGSADVPTALPENSGETDFVDSALASVSKELSTCLLQSSSSSVTYGQIFKHLWDKINQSKGYTSWKIKDLPQDEEIRRILIPSDLVKLFGTETLAVKVQRGTAERVLEYDPKKISFVPSRTIISQHIYPLREEPLPVPGGVEASTVPPPAPTGQSLVKAPVPGVWCSDKIVEESHEWIKDLQKLVAWVGSHFAATLIVGGELDSEAIASDRWLHSPLFRGGLDETWPDPTSAKPEVGRNEMLLLQVMENVGHGKKLLDKVRNALDPGSAPGGAKPQFRVARLKRQDSVEATLEKSGGIEAVDRAVRATFAALLKHTNISYTTEPISSEGALAETVVDAWKAALQLRRWIVREQQKLAAACSEKGAPSGFSPDMEAKERQQALYNAVCEPIIRRALVLLQLSPAPIQCAPSASSPMKLLPGISIATIYDFPKVSQSEPAEVTTQEPEQKRFTRQLNRMMETKSVEVMEEEDEQIHADIFSFIQQSSSNLVTTSSRESETSRHPEDQMRDILLDHQKRAKMRLKGLQTFIRLLQCTKNIPSSRFHVIPILSSAFKRVRVINGQQQGGKKTAGQASIIKVHYLADLEFAGPPLSAAIGQEFFQLLAILLESSTGHLRQVQQLIEVGVGAAPSDTKASSASIQLAVQDMLLVLETCCFPYKGEDWDHLHRTNLVRLLTDLASWKGWQSFIHFDASDDSQADVNSAEKYAILPAATGSKYPNIICSRYITLGTDLRKLTIAHKSLDGSSGNDQGCGGLAVFDKPFYRGRWYWEISVRTLGDTPVFVGVTPGTVDLNTYLPGDASLCGVFLHGERCSGDMLRSAGIRWKCSDVLGVLLNCEERQVEFYNGAKRCHVAAFSPNTLGGGGYFPSIGVKDADVHWNLAASIPSKLWCASSSFQFPNTFVSGGLVAVPFHGATISCNGKIKGSRLQLLSNGTTVSAGDSSSSEDQFETVVASQGFENGSIFVEVHVVAAGKDGRSALSFGIVDSTYLELDSPLQHKLDVKWKSAEEVLEEGIFGVLFDFDKATVTLCSNRSEPEIVQFNVAMLTKPLFPAVSALCNGTVFDVNFHPCPRAELPLHIFHPATKLQNQLMATSNELQLGKSLLLQVLSCDGGEFSSSHAASNCLVDDTTVYSSTKGANVNLVFKHEVDTPMCVSYINIRGPGPGYSSPLRAAVVFVTSTPPDLSYYQEFDNMTAEEFAALPFPPSNGYCSRDESVPVAFFVMDGSCAQVSKQLAYPVTGRYILVKAICSSAGTNIDIGYIGFCGIFDRDNGPAYNETASGSYSCEECKRMPSSGVHYGQRDDDSIRLCAACYDDNRGDLDAAYFVYTSSTTEEDQMELNTLLCPPRRSWNDKIRALGGVLNKGKDSNVAGDGHAGAAATGQTSSSERLSSVASFDDCELFSCGQNNYGELCLGHCNSTSKLEHVPFFSAKGVRDIAGGNEVLSVVMKDGAVFTCGLNKSGQCGNGTFEERVIIATPVRALSGIPINMVAAANGCEHMLAVASDGAVYSWGYNDRGQLGLGSTISKSHTPRMIDSLREKYHITTAAVSYHHSAVVSSNGELLMFGMNDCGQLGLDHTQHQHTPQLVDTLSSQVVTKVACGLYHTVAVTSGGEVYAFGKNDYGQLGLGHARNMKVPALAKTALGESDEKIVTVSCGYYHTVTISEKGKLITWGRNDYGQLGIGSKEHKNSAQFVPLPLSSKITAASCGCYHTLILMSNGRVMVFGRNNKGQLGAGSRTLPSADLPLPVPSNSLANDEVVRIAAGFYSSYILTGRSDDSRGLDSASDDASQAKDLPENSCLENSDALFESLMKEIDSKYIGETSVTKRLPLQIKRGYPQRKLPLVKLHAAGWAMARALMYRSLQDAKDSSRSRSTSARVNPVLSTFISFLLENLKLLQDDSAAGNNVMTAEASHELVANASLKRVCVSLLQFFGSKLALPSPAPGTVGSNSLHGHYYRNQILSVLLSCGSANTNVGAIIATNAVVIPHIITGMNSSDLASATVCIRLAMLVFPQHSVSALNKIYRSQQSAPALSGDILSLLMALVGLPLLLRPRLCSHELGLECSCTALCKSARCLKGVVVAKDFGVAQVQQEVLEKAHVAEAKSAEVVALLRYLTLYPTWKVAINAALTRGFAKSNQVGSLLDTVCAYYTSVQEAESVLTTGVLGELGDNTDTTSLRKPEAATSSPETDEPSSNTSDGNTDDLETTRDKQSLILWQKAKDAVDALATITAAVSIVGGNVVGFREGGYVAIEGEGSNSFGVLSGVTRDPRTADLLAQVVVEVRSDGPVSPFVVAGSRAQSFALSKLHVVERIPALVDMFDDVENIISTLSSLISADFLIDDECTMHCDLELPQNNSVQEILRNRLKTFKQQIRWRSSKALSSLLKQVSELSPTFLHAESELISSLATLLASENSLSWASKSEGSGVEAAHSLQKRWICVKQRQMFLDTEKVIDSALDHYEVNMRNEVVQKLGSENALSWGMDAIQSPRRKVNHPSFAGAASSSFGRGAGQRHENRSNEGDLPFGAWGVLLPLPPLNENEHGQAGASGQAAIDYAPFPLTVPIIRVGRAADACDLIVNDRSVSGRHFHLRRLRREGEGGEEQYELQDFSKNGTIVNGVRIHGSSTRVTSGSRISLILSRGGLVTYEFQVRTSTGSIGGRSAPPPIVTTPQNSGDLNIVIPGQEYQQPQIGTPQIVPRSPAELQNRGVQGSSTVSGICRQAVTQGLRVITSVAESNVPRALLSPNPAVDSPRAGGYSSPRSSVLQAPGTPAAAPPTPSMFSTMIPTAILSPASYQQRESFGPNEPTGVTSPRQEGGVGSMLRIALGRDSVNRDFSLQRSSIPSELSKTRVLRPGGETGLAVHSNAQEMQVLSLRLLARVQEANLVVSTSECEEALQMAAGNLDEAFMAIQHRQGLDIHNYPSNVRHLAMVLGKPERVCAKALRQTDNNFGNALRFLLSDAGAELMKSVLSPRHQGAGQSRDASYILGSNEQSSEPLVNFQDIGDENPSYALAESSAVCPPVQQRLASRGNGSPVKTKKIERPIDVSLEPKSDLTLWSECNSSFDDGIRQLNDFEIDLEEEVLCQRLAAVHARKILLHIVRLVDNASQNEEAPLNELANPLVLRPMISLLNAPQPATTKSPYDLEYQLQQQPKAQKAGKIQQILSRRTHEVMANSPTQTLAENLSSSQNLLTLQQSIDEVIEQPSKLGWAGVTRLIESLVESEQNRGTTAGEDVNIPDQPSILENLTFETILHIISRTHSAPTATMSWESSPLRTRKVDGRYPKGPIQLSCGMEVVVVDTYERLWSIPPPDPLLKHRHKWRKRFSSPSINENGMKSTADYAVTIWRPVVPPALESATPASKWFFLGDVVKCGNGAPDSPIILVSDSDNQGCLAPPASFERVDITGKGLPRNSESDPDFQRKQLRSIWWPVAPSGYVALGCVAGSKEDPFEPPDVSCTRCVREDLVKRVETFNCVWRAASPASTGGGGVELPTTVEIENEAQDDEVMGENDQVLPSRNAKNQSNDSSRIQLLLPVADDVVVQTSLWAVDSDFNSGLLLPVVTLNDTSANDPSTAFALDLSDEDTVLCAPITVDNVLAFLEVLLHYQGLVSGKEHGKSITAVQLRPELPSALFALVQQVLRENQPSSGQHAVSLLRALITVVQRGAHWYDKQSLIYCRSKIMALSQDQDGGYTLHALLQAFVELMLAVEDQQRSQRVQELAACLERDGSSTLSLPYRFHFSKQPLVEMLVSHSSKMAVSRHLSGEERKFLLDYRAEDGSNSSSRDAMAAEGLGVPPGEVYSCRFEHTPALVMTMRDEVKAEIVYFEITVVEWSTGSSMGGSLALGFSPPSFPLEGVLVGGSADSSRSYSFTPANGQVLCAGDTAVDRWRWIEPTGAVSAGDVFGCGLRLDTQEIFFTKNGQLLGTAFSSISRPQQLHPTMSFNADCKLLANLGATATTYVKNANFSFRFHSLDCDNLMSAFEWFEPLSQVYGVMKALMDPARTEELTASDESSEESIDAVIVAQLPDEFMLSADNFLSEISEDVCIRVETAHPYDLELQESLVSIPLATSIRVRLAPQSETASSHCLQILQGGGAGCEAGADSATTGGSEAEVRAFTGACGGQEVTIDGDSFVWRFPVQSNFQCRVDRVRKGPYLKLEARDTRLSLVRDKGWQTAIGVARFDGGVHIWEVRITFVTASSNIFLGIGRRDVRMDSYLGKDNRGWGWIGNRALWHNGSKQRGTYGDKFKTGDVVRLTLDLRRGTLSYALNGKDLGVAFGPGGTGPKLEGTFYPAFALYNQRDSIDLIGGHRVEDGGLEPGLSRTGSGLASGEDSYYSEEEEDLGGFAGGEEGVSDDSIPNFRMELGIALSQMGFPMDWCIYALRHCEDDAEQSADFILANMHAMESLVREETEAMARRARHRQLLHEQALALSESVEGDVVDTAAIPPPPPIESLGDETDADNAVRSAEEVVTTAEVPTSPPLQQQSTGDTKWGVAFTAVPEFSITGRRLLATKYGPKLRHLHASQQIFTPARDRALVQLVNEICESRAEALLTCDPLRMAPEEFVPTEEQIHAFPVLRGLPLEALQRRFLVLRNFNCRLQTSLAFIDFSANDERSVLARGARALRGVVFQHVKLAWWLGVLKEQQAPAAARPEIEVDRHRAHDALELSERGDSLAIEAGERDSVFAQTFEQLHGLQPALLRGADRAFKCQFVGEFGDDFGGLYRECLAQLSCELQTFTPLVSILRPCPNALLSTGENRELFVPNSHLRTNARRVQMAEFLGKLAGIAVRTKTPLDLNLPPVIWKLLVGQQVTRQDIEAIHQGCFQVVDTIANLDAHGITEAMFDEIVDASFTVLSSTRETVELVPGGRHLHVTWEDRAEYASAVETYRLTEFAPVCGDISRGVSTMLPAPTLGLFSWHELRTLVCGKASVDISLLRRRTIYGDGCQATDPHVAYFWDVLSEFTAEQKSSFLRFVWGRSRLPTHAADFTQDFKISGLPKAAGRADMYLPIAHTCFFSIDLPAYSSREVMHDKLVYAITHCQSIDADNTTVAQRAGQGINWTNTAATATATAAAAVSSVIAGMATITGE